MAKEKVPKFQNSQETKKKSKTLFPFIPILNSIALVIAVVFLYYSKFIFKRPPITEQGERNHLALIHASPTPMGAPAFVLFEPVTVNIKPIPDQPLPSDGTIRQIQGKLHYATVGFSLEIRDKNYQELTDSLRPLILDKMIQTLGRRHFHELTTIQGRYTLMSELVDYSNYLVISHSTMTSKEPLITNGYFTYFIVQ